MCPDLDAAMEIIEAHRANLSPRARYLLLRMLEAEQRDDLDDAELVYERGTGYVGTERFGGATFYALLRACVLRHVDGDPGDYEVYVLTEAGRKIACGDG